jgi:hypothetical protein
MAGPFYSSAPVGWQADRSRCSSYEEHLAAVAELVGLEMRPTVNH